jgi:DivIVA domain-containing protein
VTGDEIRRAKFRQARRGYRPEDVDAFLVQMADAADRGEPLAALVAAAAFREAKRGYRTADVDELLDRAAASSA